MHDDGDLWVKQYRGYAITTTEQMKRQEKKECRRKSKTATADICEWIMIIIRRSWRLFLFFFQMSLLVMLLLHSHSTFS